MSPQVNAFDSGIWARLERLIRDYAKHYGEAYVITGSVRQDPIEWLPSGHPTFARIIPQTRRRACQYSSDESLPNTSCDTDAVLGVASAGPKLSFSS